MFGNTPAFSSFSVNDLEKARAFYADVLGLQVANRGYVLELHTNGAGNVIIYPRDDHRPATFTVLNFQVENLEAAVAHMKARGIRLEHYDMPGLKTDEHGIFRDESMKLQSAWFCDPAGNILSVMQSG